MLVFFNIVFQTAKSFFISHALILISINFTLDLYELALPLFGFFVSILNNLLIFFYFRSKISNFLFILLASQLRATDFTLKRRIFKLICLNFFSSSLKLLSKSLNFSTHQSNSIFKFLNLNFCLLANIAHLWFPFILLVSKSI